MTTSWPLGQNGGHHHVIRTQYGGTAVTAHINGGANKTVWCIDDQVTTLYLDAGAQRLDAANMQINRTVTDNTAAGQGKHAFLHAGHERPQQADGGTHFPHLLVRGLVGDAVGGFNSHCATGALYGATQLAENLEHVVGVGYVRHACDSHGLIGEQGCCKNGE